MILFMGEMEKIFLKAKEVMILFMGEMGKIFLGGVMVLTIFMEREVMIDF